MTLLSVALEQTDDLDVSVDNREEAVLIHIVRRWQHLARRIRHSRFVLPFRRSLSVYVGTGALEANEFLVLLEE